MHPKKMIIVGATSGIGKHLAEHYLVRGWRVGVTGRRTNLLADFKEKWGERVCTAAFDVTVPGLQLHLERLVTELAGIDLFLYNAGFGAPADGLHLENEVRTIRTNVDGFVEAMHFAFTYFMKQDEGRIALISSVAALRGMGRAPAYSASKAFMSNYAEGLNALSRRLEKKILVTDIRPGFVDTKPAAGHRRFWSAPPEKAARQIAEAIESGKRTAYITRRWWIIAQLLKVLPFTVHRKI